MQYLEMARTHSLPVAFVLPLFLSSCLAVKLDTSSPGSVSQAAKIIVSGIMETYYNATSTSGDFNQPEPWYWWLSGSGWTAVMDYTVYTNDTTYKSSLLSALSKNVGTNFDFVPAAQAAWEANDDQAYWLYSALTALEYGFDNIDPCIGNGTGANGTCANSWLSIATNAFSVYVTRWNADSVTCGGGLKWQYNPSANGYTYKNAVSNGGFFQTAARLARYTGNATYADWAGRIWDWSTAVGLVGPTFHVFDGTSDASTDNCTALDGDEWSYNVATYLHGAAHMYAYTGGDRLWEARVAGLLGAANATFFSPPMATTTTKGAATANASGVMYEPKCEMSSSCSIDQTSFKSSLSRWMGKAAMLVPSVRNDIMALLATSAKGAAASCANASSSSSSSSSSSGSMACGMQWWTADGYDGYSDFGSMLSALEVVQGLLVTSAPKLATLVSS